MDEVIYKGYVDEDRRIVVRAGDRDLSPARSLAVWGHSPDGFQWGYQGSGPAQLALALLLEAGVDEFRASTLHQEFKRAVVSRWHIDEPWAISRSAILAWVETAWQARLLDIGSRGRAIGNVPRRGKA